MAAIYLELLPLATEFNAKVTWDDALMSVSKTFKLPAIKVKILHKLGGG